MKRCMGCMQEYDESQSSCPSCGYSDELNNKIRKQMPDILPVETIIGSRYIIGRVLSYTKYSIIYLGWDWLLKKRVAVKEYFPVHVGIRGEDEKEIVINEKKKEAFEKGKIDFKEDFQRLHMNQDKSFLVNVYRLIEENNTMYMIMEYVEGITLREYVIEKIHAKEWTMQEQLSIAAMIEEQLRNLKKIFPEYGNLTPDNVYISTVADSIEQVYLMSPGNGKIKYFLRNLKEDIYDERYIPNEMRKKGIRKKIDSYALGKIYYFILTGKESKKIGYCSWLELRKIKDKKSRILVKKLVMKNYKKRSNIKTLDQTSKIENGRGN